MRRVVLDANVYVSALGYGGVANEVVSAGMDGAFYLVASDLIRREVEENLRKKFGWDAERIALLEPGLWSWVSFVSSQKRVEVCRDPKDNHLLETSWESGADLLVSGDKGLLVLSIFEGTQIASLRSFADELIAGAR